MALLSCLFVGPSRIPQQPIIVQFMGPDHSRKTKHFYSNRMIHQRSRIDFSLTSSASPTCGPTCGPELTVASARGHVGSTRVQRKRRCRVFAREVCFCAALKYCFCYGRVLLRGSGLWGDASPIKRELCADALKGSFLRSTRQQPRARTMSCRTKPSARQWG
jgi:hypothetical protein